jgi:hypothetical protein
MSCKTTATLLSFGCSSSLRVWVSVEASRSLVATATAQQPIPQRSSEAGTQTGRTSCWTTSKSSSGHRNDRWTKRDRKNWKGNEQRTKEINAPQKGKEEREQNGGQVNWKEQIESFFTRYGYRCKEFLELIDLHALTSVLLLSNCFWELSVKWMFDRRCHGGRWWTATKACHLARSTHSTEQVVIHTVNLTRCFFEVDKSIPLGHSFYIIPSSHYKTTPRHPSTLQNDQ